MPENYEKYNPLNHVDELEEADAGDRRASNDYRVPYSQGLSTFTALQRRGIPSRLLVFPNENHWVLKPANSMLWHQTVIDWLDTYTKKK